MHHTRTDQLLYPGVGGDEETMAINFSASFAACLAAGLKVPRQFMYCIAQGWIGEYEIRSVESQNKRNAVYIALTRCSLSQETAQDSIDLVHRTASS
ncbi:hypothetical protein J6590_054080 [Homalodisca vitripennis]|nr:hypothetical protein J6590_054080 [Homalodisca vitripennis]